MIEIGPVLQQTILGALGIIAGCIVMVFFIRAAM
jgi:hypothetical protein